MIVTSICSKMSESARKIAADGPGGMLVISPGVIVSSFESIDETARIEAALDVLERLSKGATIAELFAEVAAKHAAFGARTLAEPRHA